MKIVYTIAATSNSGGMERVLTNKANYLSSQGHEVYIITTDQRGKSSFFSLNKKIKCYDLCINYEINNGKSVLNKLIQYPAKQLKHKRELTRLLKDIKADIVISMFCNDESFITKIKDGSKKILEIHFSKFKRIQYARNGLWRVVDIYRTKQDEKYVQKFDKFVVLTEEDKTYWNNINNITVIPNPRTFNPNEIASLDEKKVIAVGRLTHQKGFDILIDIWQKVCAKNNDWHLDIIGDGEMRKELEQKINNLNISDRISLTPPTKDIHDKYLQSSILALSSRYEGLPMILLEAQVYGIPVVSFECKCGPKDIITDGKDGFLITEGDVDSFANKLLQLMSDSNLRKEMGTAAKINSEKYSEEKVMKLWLNLFKNLLAK